VPLRRPLGPATPSGIRAASAQDITGSSPALDLSAPSVTLAVRRDDPRAWWVVPALASAGSLALGVVLGAVLFGGNVSPPAREPVLVAPVPCLAPPDAGVVAEVVTPDAGVVAVVAPDAGPPPPPGAIDLGQGACLARVESLPPRAHLSLAGRELGIGPVDVIGVPCDEPVVVEARLEKWEPFRRQVTFRADRPGRFVASLRRIQVEVALTSSPPGALVTLGGKPAGKTPLRARVNAFVRTSVKLSMAGYKEVDTQLVARPGKASDLAVTLERLPKPAKKR
jgi:hypothetical protein